MIKSICYLRVEGLSDKAASEPRMSVQEGEKAKIPHDRVKLVVSHDSVLVT